MPDPAWQGSTLTPVKPRAPQSTIVVSAVAVAMVLFGGLLCLAIGAGGWLVAVCAVSLLAAGLYALSLLPSAHFEDRLVARPYLPLDQAGRPVSGNPAVQQLAGLIGQNLSGTPYHVLTSPGSVRFEWNTADPGVRSLLASHDVERAYATVLAQGRRPGVFLRRDSSEAFDSRKGVLEASDWAAIASGRIRRFERHREYALTDRGFQLTANFSLNTNVIDRAVAAALAQIGARQRLGQTQIA